MAAQPRPNAAAAAQVLPPCSRLLADHDVGLGGQLDACFLDACLLMVDLVGDKEVPKLWPLLPPAAAMSSPWGSTDERHVRSVIGKSGSSRLRCRAEASEGSDLPLVHLMTGPGAASPVRLGGALLPGPASESLSLGLLLQATGSRLLAADGLEPALRRGMGSDPE